MTDFKHFIRREYRPIPIYHQPIHGGHAGGRHMNEATEKKMLSDFLNSHANEHIHKDMEGVHKVLQKHSSKIWDDHLHKDHKAAVKKYTDWSANLNKKLIQAHKEGVKPFELSPEKKKLLDMYGHSLLPYNHPEHDAHFEAVTDHEQDDEHRHTMTHLDDMLHNHHRNRDHHIYVYHGVGFHPGVEAAKHPDRKIMLPTFTSTTLNPNIADNFTKFTGHKNRSAVQRGHMLKIHIKPHHKGMYIGDNSSRADEKEFLLPRKTILRVNRTPTVYHDDQRFTGPWATPKLHVWHATVEGQDHDH